MVGSQQSDTVTRSLVPFNRAALQSYKYALALIRSQENKQLIAAYPDERTESNLCMKIIFMINHPYQGTRKKMKVRVPPYSEFEMGTGLISASSGFWYPDTETIVSVSTDKSEITTQDVVDNISKYKIIDGAWYRTAFTQSGGVEDPHELETPVRVSLFSPLDRQYLTDE